MQYIEQTETYEICSDGNTVWVNAPTLVGRFGKFGIDIHRASTDQSVKGECLLCTHHTPLTGDWKLFQDKMKEFYNIVIHEKHRPKWLPSFLQVVKCVD